MTITLSAQFSGIFVVYRPVGYHFFDFGFLNVSPKSTNLTVPDNYPECVTEGWQRHVKESRENTYYKNY